MWSATAMLACPMFVFGCLLACVLPACLLASSLLAGWLLKISERDLRSLSEIGHLQTSLSFACRLSPTSQSPPSDSHFSSIPFLPTPMVNILTTIMIHEIKGY